MGLNLFPELKSPILIVLITGLLFPWIVPFRSLGVEILIFALAAVSCNILLGYTGLLSLGQAALFAVGAYATGLISIHLNLSPLLSLLCGAIAGALIAFVIGIFSIQRLGIYFIMLTLAFNQLVFFIAYEWVGLTGGDNGLLDIPRPPLFFGQGIHIDSVISFYYFVLLVFMVCFFVIQRIINSPFGQVLQAVRENEDRAWTVGFSIKRYKLTAFIISGFFTGIAGGLYALFLQLVPINAVELMTSAEILIMTLVGGTGSLYGPLIGSAVVKIFSEILSTLWSRWLLLLGIIYIIFIMFMKGGIWGLMQSVKNWSK